MSKFINDCELKGFRPKSFYSKTYNVRNKLISKMLADRNLIRVVCAPNCYGKSTLCCQYSEIIFGFKETFWIDCSNPCFLRDLDSGELKKSLCGNKHIKLVVFDDLVYLHEQRSEALMDCVYKLLSCDIETVINLTPLAKPALPFDKDCLFINGDDLMAPQKNSQDMDVFNKLCCESSKNNNLYENSYVVRFAFNQSVYRVPSLYYSKSKNFSELLENNVPDNIPFGVVFCIFYVYATQAGNTDYLKNLVSKSDFNLFKNYCLDEPHIFLDLKARVFSTPPIDVNKVCDLFANRIKNFIDSYFKTDIDMWKNIVENCISVSNYNRAFEVLRYNFDAEQSIKYLEEFYLDALLNMQFANATLICDQQNLSTNVHDLNTKFLQSWSLQLLGMKDRSLEIAYDLLESSTDSTIGILSALLFYVYGTSKDRSNAFKLLTCFNKSEKEDTGLLYSFANIAVNLVLCSKTASSMNSYLKHFSKLSFSEIHMLACALLLRIVQNNSNIAYVSVMPKIIENCTKYCTDNWAIRPSIGIYLFCVNLSACDMSVLNFWNLDIDTYKNLMQIQLDLSSLFKMEIATYCGGETKDELNNADLGPVLAGFNSVEDDFKNLDTSDIEVSDVIERMKNASPKVPLLRINLFSKFEIYIGDYKIPAEKIKRKMVQSLLAILVIRAGHDVTGDELTKILWPKSSFKSAYCNLNSVWVHARKLLSIDGKECPYLTRIHKGFAVDTTNFTSDVLNIDRLLEKYALDKVEPKYWVDFARQNFSIIKGELMPGNSDNIFISRYRKIYKSKILDALLCASQRLCDEGFFREALWFARLCFDLDHCREDVYTALMMAQYRSGNRSSSIDTYMACTKMIEEEQKTEISKRTQEIYSKIVAETL